jgi:hypothetical protein
MTSSGTDAYIVVTFPVLEDVVAAATNAIPTAVFTNPRVVLRCTLSLMLLLVVVLVLLAALAAVLNTDPRNPLASLVVTLPV